MIALTYRLKERDESMTYFSEELYAYDRINRETKLNIENKN